MNASFYEQLLDNASDVIWAIDTEGRITYVNDCVREWGYEREELLTQPLLSILNTKLIGKRENVHTLLGISQIHEMEIVNKRGESYTVMVKSSPLRAEDGAVIGMIGFIRDVTKTHLLEEKLKNEERLASLGRLAAGIAHEIRNPLSSIKMNLTILKKRLRPSLADLEHFEIAQEEVANLERIVTELLDYAKPITLNLRWQNLHERLAAVLASLRPVLKERGIKVEFKPDPAISMALFDQGKLHQAMLNVLLNAVQASRPGSTVIMETRAGEAEHAPLQILVRDFGKGIEPDNLKYVFDPFYSTRSNGTGLGLSVVRNIIRNHNGSVTIESEPGAGTTVRLELPAGLAG
ncbi:MAG: PAS domain S-box protein [Nitrospinae bacterium]|nr:PAS domain S-box protein [Nitrospinota bacterium]